MKTRDDFYRWARGTIDGEKEATNPLNWMTLAKYCTELKELKDSLGIKSMMKAMREVLIGKKYRYTVYPVALKGKLEKLTMEMFIGNELFASWIGVLKWDKERNFFALTNPHCKSFPLKWCWIIEEIKAGH